MGILNDLVSRFRGRSSATEATVPGETTRPSTEIGRRPNLIDQTTRIYREMFVYADLRQSILDIRSMDRLDARVKRIHGRTARTAVKGGLVLDAPRGRETLRRRWRDFERRCGLNQRDKLESDFRGLMAEGNLPLQIVISTDGRPQVVQLVRMPAETIVPRVDETGRYKDPGHAFDQIAWPDERAIAQFALWQLVLKRLSPENYDDFGCMGRPYLDATRKVWQQLSMTEADMVVRRRTRAPQRMAHLMKGMDREQLEAYRADVEADQADGNWKDYYANTDGSIQAVGGDANLDQIADVVHLLDTFFAGAPAPKGLFGYAGDLSRDILEDLKRDYYDELDSMQELVAEAYEQAFRIELLLAGVNPDADDFTVRFAERQAETPNQRSDRALKQQALGASKETVWRTAGLDPARERQNLEREADDLDPYPTDVAGDDDPDTPPRAPGAPRVSITPGNERKGDSGTAISN